MHQFALRAFYLAAMAAIVLAIGASAHHDRNRYYEIRDNTWLDRNDPVCRLQELDVEVRCASASNWTEIGDTPLQLRCDEDDDGIYYRDTRDWDFNWRYGWSCDADPPGPRTAQDVNRYVAQVTVNGTLDCRDATPRLSAQAACEYDFH